MNDVSSESLVYDWNLAGSPTAKPAKAIGLVDETLRDGLQNPSVRTPALDEKLQILHLMHDLGITACDIGLPGAGGQMKDDCLTLAKEIARCKLDILPNCAARTVVSDIEPLVELNEKSGTEVEVSMFIGSSPVRQYAEDWTLDRLLGASEKALAFAQKHQIPVMYVTEDTTRARPETLERLYGLAMDMGARRLCVCDTVGHVTPHGVHHLIRFIKELITRKKSDALIDWHGHMDRGLGVINTIAAIDAGADRVHGCGLGIGERAGNTPMDTLLVNLRLMGYIDNDLSKLGEYVRTVARAVDVPISHNYPIFGQDAFETATGVHAAAVIKAMRKGDVWLENLVYSGVPAHIVGLSQNIKVGPLSGKSNVIYWLDKHGHATEEKLVEAILTAAKASPSILTDEQIEAIVAASR